MSWRQLTEWQVYDELEPFGPDREDYRIASVVQALWNIARDPVKYPNGWPIEDFVLKFGDAPRPPPRQTLQTQELLIDAWIAGSNAIFAAKAAKEQ